jgi:hypothetical protein
MYKATYIYIIYKYTYIYVSIHKYRPSEDSELPSVRSSVSGVETVLTLDQAFRVCITAYDLSAVYHSMSSAEEPALGNKPTRKGAINN